MYFAINFIRGMQQGNSYFMGVHMTAQAIDFLGISLSDSALVPKLDEFLNKHEQFLSVALVHQMRYFAGSGVTEDDATMEFDSAIKHVKAILIFCKGAGKLNTQSPASQNVTKSMNGILWEQVELLEGFVNELFHQLSFVSVLKWQESLKNTLDGFEQVLLKHISKAQALVTELRDVMQYSLDSNSGNSWLTRWFKSNGKDAGIDEELSNDLKNCENILRQHGKQFREQFAKYQTVAAEIDTHTHKLKSYDILASLGGGAVDQFESLFRFLKLWESLETSHTISQEALLKAFQNFSRDKVITLLRDYYNSLEEALFEKSRTLKTSPIQLFNDLQGRSFILDIIRGYRKELHVLGSTIVKLKDFLLKSNPDPYVRSRWGFGDTPVGEEPKYAHKLTELNLSVEQLDGYFNRMIAALEKGPQEEDKQHLSERESQIDHSLHLIAQPLTTSRHFNSHSEKILDLLDKLGELEGYGRDVVDYVRQVLGKLLRADWKEHVLTTLPHFQRLYKIHQGIIGSPIDPGHSLRLEKFKKLLQQISSKMRREGTEQGTDIEYDISDIQGYFQDFLATLQRSIKDESMAQRKSKRYVEEGAQQLLEYRYLFGEFFASLKKEPEGQYLRQQFLFVDQYFEAIENKIYEFRLQRGLLEQEER